MKLINIVFAVIIFCSYNMLGQDEQSEKVKLFKVSDFYLQIGSFSGNKTYCTKADFKRLFPASALLRDDLSDYSSSPGFSKSGGPALSFLMGIQIKEKMNPLLRIGLSYFPGPNITSSYYKEERNRYDTLTSSQTGDLYYLDSLVSKMYNMNYSSEQIRFDGSIIYRTDNNSRWTLYGGVGFTFGMSIYAKTNINYNQYEYDDAHLADSKGSSSNSSSYPKTDIYISESFKNDYNVGFSTYLPLGINFRFGKKRPFWKMINLFYEIKPGIHFTSISELRNDTFTLIQNGIGLKISWN